jgi:hypothetical protein
VHVGRLPRLRRTDLQPLTVGLEDLLTSGARRERVRRYGLLPIVMASAFIRAEMSAGSPA